MKLKEHWPLEIVTSDFCIKFDFIKSDNCHKIYILIIVKITQKFKKKFLLVKNMNIFCSDFCQCLANYLKYQINEKI